MHSLYEKLYYIIGELLLHTNTVTSISKPLFLTDSISFRVSSSNGVSKNIELPIRDLIINHDHTLENYIVQIIKEYEL